MIMLRVICIKKSVTNKPIEIFGFRYSNSSLHQK